MAYAKVHAHVIRELVLKKMFRLRAARKAHIESALDMHVGLFNFFTYPLRVFGFKPHTMETMRAKLDKKNSQEWQNDKNWGWYSMRECKQLSKLCRHSADGCVKITHEDLHDLKNENY